MSDYFDFQQIKFSLSQNQWIIISSECIDLEADELVISADYCGFKISGLRNSDSNKNHLIYREEDAGFYNFQIEETIKYTIQVSSGISLKELADIGLKRIANNVFNMQIINFLGKSAFSIESESEQRKIDFEIISNKIDYKKDYISLTEKIANCCSQLLIDYSSAANLDFEYDEQNEQKTLLEQFLFIRQFCSADNIDYIMSAIINNPDRILESEIELKPYGTDTISKSFFSNPFANSQDWKYTEGQFKPGFITTTRKFDSYDTPANRFVKFALNTFLSICEHIETQIYSKETLFYQREAKCLKENLELFLSNNFFQDISDLDIMPMSNQVLQKREGYSQILNAFNMLDLALKLKWPGKDKIYMDESTIEGEVKNTALLYEYWLFFELFNILKDLSEDIPIEESDSNAFISSHDGSLLISLKEGNTSKISFKIKNSELRVNLYYNKTFSKVPFSRVFENSYSRDFRPDYTLEFYKGDFKEAKKNGQLSYIHFDAKYRLTDLSSWFTDETTVEVEKKDEIVNTYKRGDLLKMHTYNDAIRRTLGSYVLYPGAQTNKNTIFNVYDELLPGVGAFAIKPSNHVEGETVLKRFIEEIVAFQETESSREKRIRYYENNILNYVGLNESFEPKNSNEFCMIGFLRKDYYTWLKEKDFLNEKKSFYFYFHAIRDGNVISLNQNIHKASFFCGYLTDPGEKDELILENWIAEIGPTQLVSNKILCSKLNEIGYTPKTLNAEFYYLVELKNLKPIVNNSLKNNIYYRSNGNFAESRYSPFVCTINEIIK